MDFDRETIRRLYNFTINHKQYIPNLLDLITKVQEEWACQENHNYQ